MYYCRDIHREPGRRINSGRLIQRERDRDFGYRGSDRNERRDRDHFDREERELRDGRITRDRSGKDRNADRRGNRERGGWSSIPLFC